MQDILFLTHRLPYPPNRGDKIRGYHVIEHLAQRARVHLVGFADNERELGRRNGLAKLTASQTIIHRGKSRALAVVEALATRQPVSLTAFASEKLHDAVDAVMAAHPIDAIYVFSGQMAQYIPDRAKRVVMDFVDMDSAKFNDYAAASCGLTRLMYRREARLLQAFEVEVARRADASLFVSAAEAALFAERTGIDEAIVIENGIDIVRFNPAASFDRVTGQSAPIVFTGQMDYRPNIEAVTWFAQSVLPLVRTRFPEQRFAIVGRNPTEAVRALSRLPGVIVTGEVLDVRGWQAAAGVVVAPLKIARGVQNKVLEAMAMGRPVVASASAAEGLDYGGTIRVADDSTEFADEIIALLQDPQRAAALGAAARERVTTRYGWAAALAQLDRLLGLDAPNARAAA